MLLNVIRLLLPTQNMGVNHGAKVLYSARGLYIQDAATILRGLARERGMKIPMIDVDCSNVCFKVGKNVQSLASFLMRWATPGLRVIPSCDAKVRPISKQATNQRKANRDKNRIKSSVLRKDIRELRRRCYCDVNSRDEILTDINVKERACKTAETASNNVIQTDLAEKLEKELEQSVAHSSNIAGGFVDRVMTAEFQADALMMGRSISGVTLMIVSSDADIPIIAGDDCIAIKEFTKDGGIEVVCTSRSTLCHALSFLSDEDRRHTTFHPAEHPIFEGVSDRKLRALMALILGCDVYPKGMSGVGAKSLADIVNIKYPAFKKRCPHASLFGYLKKYLYSKTDGFHNDVVHTYLRAIVYEPTNALPENEDSNCNDNQPTCYRTYLGGSPPTKLPAYLEEFADPNTEIFAGPEMKMCRGVGIYTHRFLAADGFRVCAGCDGVVCQHCMMNIEANPYCLPCYAQEKLVPMALKK
mmetsp:Transcript_2837/g.5150  ORF Transcript_2837/g.5150 Transcript_2837/m.5150 type:complete len:472 (-) Transcript_2837:1596-3011(-)